MVIVQLTPWQEAYNSVIRLSISEQLQVLFALAKKLGFGDRLPASLNESDYMNQELNLYERSDFKDDVEQKTDSEYSVKYGNGEPYSFFKVASALNLDDPPGWPENVDAYLAGSEDDAKQKIDSECTVKHGDGEPYSFLKVASTLNLDGPPDWSENVDAYLYGGKSLNES